jgi:hypothetical protein
MQASQSTAIKPKLRKSDRCERAIPKTLLINFFKKAHDPVSGNYFKSIREIEEILTTLDLRAIWRKRR